MARTQEEWHQYIKDLPKRQEQKMQRLKEEAEAKGYIVIDDDNDFEYDYTPKYRQQDSLYDDDGEYRYNEETGQYDYYPDWLGNSMTEESFWESR